MCFAADEFARARSLYDQKHVPAAQAILAKLCAPKTATPAALCLYADTFLLDDLLDAKVFRSDHLARRAISLDPQWGNAYKILAQGQNLREHYAEAIDLCNRALTVKKPDREALLQRCLANQALGNKQAALEDITLYTKTNNEPKSYILKASLLDQCGKPAEALIAYKHVARLQQSDLIIVRIADCYARQKKYREAIDEINILIKASPKDGDARFYRARYYLALKEFDRALGDYTDAIALEPTAKYYRERAALLMQLGRTAQASVDIKKAEACLKPSL